MTGYNGILWNQERELQSKKSHAWVHVKRREGKGGEGAPSLTLLNQNQHPFNKYCISNNTLQATRRNI